MASVWLSKSAFISIVTSSIEVYKKESFGLLFGFRRNRDYFVKYAVNTQSARRHYDYIDIDEHRIRRINESASKIMKHKFIGDFHSHADGPSKPSKADIKDMRETGTGFAYFLVIVQRKKKEFRWKHETDRSVSGTVGRYFVRLKAYEIIRGRLEKIKIRCPYLANVNKIR